MATKKTRPSTRGFSRSMGLKESQMREQYNEFEQSRKRLEEKLIDKWENKEGLDLGNGKLASLYESNPKKASGLALFLEATQKNVSQLNEYQTSAFMGVTPQEIVKIARIAYPNAVMGDLFDVWGMESVKDTFYKIESKVGSTARGATEGDVIQESFSDGRYSSEIIEDESAGDGTDNYTGTITPAPIRPFQTKIWLNDEQIGVDDGAGNLIGSGISVGTIDNTTGNYDITLTSTIDSTYTLLVECAYNSEDEDNFAQQGTVKLDLVAYDFRAKFFSLGVSWHAMAEEIMQSKLRTSARDTLIQSASELMIKNMDELALRYGKKASSWHQASNPIAFNADFASAGADSSYARAQDITDEAIDKATGLAYNALGRYASQYNLVCGTSANSYLKKHKLYSPDNAQSRIGVFKTGTLDSMGVYKAPSDLVGANDIYIFGKGTDAMNVDSAVSVGTYRLGMETDTLTRKSFDSEKGLGAMADFRINEKRFASKVSITGLN
ncbi:MAG: hypothetical protein PF569_01645 [Candidatus Woesearchaeota archaeon]|jgi:hypothetical protein|nr:hypothetical protein [Candidatus Woesearchaeota archaeon]